MSQEISATACQVLVHNASVRRILVRCHVMLVSIVKHDLFVFVDSNLIYKTCKADFAFTVFGFSCSAWRVNSTAALMTLVLSNLPEILTIS